MVAVKEVIIEDKLGDCWDFKSGFEFFHYFDDVFICLSLSLSLMVLLSVCLRGAMVFSKKSVNEWVAEYENEKLWCMVWSRDGFSSLGFNYWEFCNARGEKGRLKGEDPGSHSLERRELQEDSKVKTTHREQVILRNAC